MKLLRLALDNFRGAPNGAWSFTRPNDGGPLDAVFITGPAASGKTSFLEAIAALKESIGPYGAPPIPARLLRRGANSGRVEGTWQLSAEEMARAETTQATWTTKLELGKDVVIPPADPALRKLFEAYGHDPGQGKFEYFPSNRRLVARAGRRYLSLDAEARLRLGAEPDKYASIKQELIDLALSDGVRAVEESTARGILLRADQRDSLAPYRKDIADFLPALRLTGVDMDSGSPELRFERVDGTELFLDDLCDSEKQAVLFCVAFRRIGLSRSIVLVDQPELYLHSDAQLRFAEAIGGLGEGNQIFLATGSPDVMRMAAPHQIVHLGPGAKG